MVEKIKKIEDEFNLNLKLGLMILGYGIMLFIPDLLHQLVYNIKHTFYIKIVGYEINPKYVLVMAGTILTFAGVMQEKPKALKSFGMAALGLLYISVSWGLMMSLKQVEYKNSVLYIEGDKIYKIYLPVIVITCMWVNDTMAYLVGSIIGKTPLSKISPKKTWEGTIGGIILSSLLVGFFGFILDEWFVFNKPYYWWVLLTLIASVAGTYGDLLESKLKRLAGVKDSGSIMPGHGGFLDRFDSLLLAIPFVWLYVYLFL